MAVFQLFLLFFILPGVLPNSITINGRSLESNLRFKRETGEYNSMMCTLSTCFAGQFARKFGYNIRIQFLEELWKLFLTVPRTRRLLDTSDIFSPLLFERFCNSYTSMKECLPVCTESFTKTVVEMSIAPVDFLCYQHYSEFQNALPCFGSVFWQVEENCAQTCAHLEIDPNADSKTVASQSCTRAVCLRDCSLNELNRLCNDEASQLFDQFISFTARSVMRVTEYLGDSSPVECRPLL